MATKKKVAAADAEKLDGVLVDSGEAKVNLDETTDGVVNIDDSALIKVKSNVFGELFFVDPATKEQVSWEQCGAIQVLNMGMLRRMKSGAVKFFTDQLVIITGFADANAEKYMPADIYKALYITQYYKDFLDPSDYEYICSWTPSEIREKVPMLSAVSKTKLIVALNTYIERGLLDSLKSIRTFEEVLGCELNIPS